MPKVLSGWKTVRLGDAVSVKHGYAFSGEFFSDDGQFVVVTPGNFHDAGGFKAKSGKEKFFSGDFDDSYLLDKDDLIVAMTEQTPGLLGSAALVPANGVYLHNQRIGLIEVTDPLVIDKRFLYYLLNTGLVRSQIQATATGTKVRHTAPARIEEVRALIPLVPMQRGIVRSLMALDDLIENNRRRIELLEETARLLYREWFVNFRYPGHEGVPLLDSDLGPIPEGFRRGCFGDLVRHVADWIEPQEIHREMPVMDLKDFPNGSTTLIRWGYAKDISSRRAHFQEGDVLFGKLRPYFHKVLWAPFDGVCTPSAFVFRAQETVFQTLALSVASSKHFVDIATGSSTGTTMPSTPIDVLLGYPLAIPPTELIVEFDKQIRPLVTTCSVLAATVRGTEEIRDLTLPRLVSGDLDISDLNLGLEAVS